MLRAKGFQQWKGFEIPPEGRLLQQLVEISGDMGHAYERSVHFYKDFHRHERMMLIFPRSGCTMNVTDANSKTVYTIDSQTSLSVPKTCLHDDKGTSSVYDTLALYPSDDLINSVAATLDDAQQLLSYLYAGCILIKRSNWLTELVERYFEEFIYSNRRTDPEARFFERRILLEFLNLVIISYSEKDSFSAANNVESSVTKRAIMFIESNLFNQLSLKQIAKRSHTSVSNLNRFFKRDLEITTFEYIRNRRLDEAMSLLTSEGDKSVGEIALLVGYENLGAFSEAFKKRFGHAPSHFAAKRQSLTI
jgi:AraC-like DNA-binding protein